MRILLIAISILALCSGGAICAPFKVPQDVYSVDRLEEAKLAAQKSAKPLGFLESDPEDEDIAEPTTAIMRELRAKVVLVFVAWRTGDWNKLPPSVQQALTSPPAGRYIPRAVVLSPDLKSLIASIPATIEDGAERRRLHRAASKLIGEALVKMQQEQKSFDSKFKR